VDLQARTFGRRHLVVRRHEAIAHTDGSGCGAPGDRQQQRDVRPGSRPRRGPAAFLAPGDESGSARQQRLVANCLLGRSGHRYGIEQSQCLLRLAAVQHHFGSEQRVLARLLGGEGPLRLAEHPSRVIGALRGDVIVRGVEQQAGAIGASVLRGELLVDARRPCGIAGALELLRAIDRRRQLSPLTEARTARQSCGGERQEREANEGADVHRLKSLSLRGRMPAGRDPTRREARL